MDKKILKEIYFALEFLASHGFFADSEKEAQTNTKAQASKTSHLSTRKRRVELYPRKKGNKLYPKEVMEIYKEKRLSAKELAEYFGVTEGTIYDIKRGYTWSKLTGHVFEG
jgi:hypothetical protein